MSRIFVYFRSFSYIYIYIYLPKYSLKCNRKYWNTKRKREREGERKKRERRDIKNTRKMKRVASYSFYKAVAVRFQRKLGINQVWIDWRWRSALYACNSELYPADARHCSCRDIDYRSCTRCVRPPILFNSHCVSSRSKSQRERDAYPIISIMSL